MMGVRIFKLTIKAIVIACWAGYAWMAIEYLGQQIDYAKVSK